MIRHVPLTESEIKALVPGRELDARIAHAIYAWRWYRDKKSGLYAFQPSPKHNLRQGPRPPRNGVWYQWPWTRDLYEPAVLSWPSMVERVVGWNTNGQRWHGDRDVEEGCPRVSTDPVALDELRDYLWRTGAFKMMQPTALRQHNDKGHEGASFVRCMLVARTSARAWTHEESFHDAPMAAERLAWCKVALLYAASLPNPLPEPPE